MIQLLRARVFEAVNFAALWINSRHDMFDNAILARRVHCLKNEQDRVAIVRVEKILEFTETADLLLEQLSIMRFRFVECFGLSRAFAEPKRLMLADAEF